MIKIDKKDIQRLIKGMQKIEKNVDNVAVDSLNELTAIAIAEAKRNTMKGESLDTNLRDSYFPTEMVKEGNTYSRSVKNDARNQDGELYLIYYEYGHRTRLGTSKNPLYKPKVGAKAWVRGRYPLLKGSVKARSASKRIISKNMKKHFERK